MKKLLAKSDGQSKNLPNEKKVREVLRKGAPPKEETPDAEAPGYKQINIRLLLSERDRINKLRDNLPMVRGKRMAITLHDWIVQAINEKLERDEA
jgi:hypothetical protein